MRVSIASLDEPPRIGCGLVNVQLWILPDSTDLPRWVDRSALTAAEQIREAAIRHAQARHHFLRGRLLLRTLLGCSLGVAASSIALSTTPDGKPMLADPTPGLHFNVSHTEGYVLVGLGPRPLGVDVETQRERDYHGLVQRYFAPEEQEQFFSLPAALYAAAFTRGWTCKEALLKGTGAGVRDLQHCAVDLDPRRPAAVRRGPDARGWSLEHWWITKQVQAALAICHTDV